MCYKQTLKECANFSRVIKIHYSRSLVGGRTPIEWAYTINPTMAILSDLEKIIDHTK